jgi:excisionase family DNA binding protein
VAVMNLHPTQAASGVGALSLSVKDAATVTSLSQDSIRDAINRGQLPAIRVGRRIAILVSDLTDWLHSQPKVGA